MVGGWLNYCNHRERYVDAFTNVDECDYLHMLTSVFDFVFGYVICIVDAPPYALHRVERHISPTH